MAVTSLIKHITDAGSGSADRPAAAAARKAKREDPPSSANGRRGGGQGRDGHQQRRGAPRDRDTASALSVVRIGARGSQILLDGRVARGSGVVLSNVPIIQDKVYWEVRVLKVGRILVGVSRELVGDYLENLAADGDGRGAGGFGDGVMSWARAFGVQGGIPVAPDDVISCTFDQSDIPTRLAFRLNGKALDSATISGVKGEVRPAVGIAEGACVEVNFDPSHCRHLGACVGGGFSCLMVSRLLYGGNG
ncbi:unnamed protein product [Vitrella brassicaformis CCMP3155]|uniref:SPRY domain-containing protein 7 n=1 Tax=Vitrella brassicaformis (strain CCMP3155) TaxID=1169540 RepID=A0A0G4E9K5_VITBC|nr:unnamed protein product [Vitrella brassicaformis CCMP3155]|eukprot:CEL92292.1 unnamed protein product [Vitrella brassicaformis CCMP3155]